MYFKGKRFVFQYSSLSCSCNWNFIIFYYSFNSIETTNSEIELTENDLIAYLENNLSDELLYEYCILEDKKEDDELSDEFDYLFEYDIDYILLLTNLKLNIMYTKTTLIALLCPLFMFSQNILDKKREKIEIEKIAYITKALNLSSEEAQVFWPLYNKYSDKKNEIDIKRMKEFAKVKDNRSSLTEKEIGSIINKQLKMEQEILDLKVNYNKEFQKVISNTQISKLYHAELEFRKNSLEEYQKGIGHNNYINTL